MSETESEKIFTMGVIVKDNKFVVTIDKESHHIIVYSKIDEQLTPVGNGKWDSSTQDIVDGHVMDSLLDDDTCDGIVTAVRTSTWSALQWEK